MRRKCKSRGSAPISSALAAREPPRTRMLRRALGRGRLDEVRFADPRKRSSVRRRRRGCNEGPGPSWPQSALSQAGCPQALVKIIEAPRIYDPRKLQDPGNRALDKTHLQGIVHYLEQETDFVIGATTLYVRPGVVSFQSMGGDGDRPVQLGYVIVPI